MHRGVIVATMPANRECGEACVAPLHGADMEMYSMPITMGMFYRTYEDLLRRGLLQLEGIACPR